LKYSFGANELLGDEDYIRFLNSFLSGVEQRKGFTLELQFRITDRAYRTLKAFHYQGGSARPCTTNDGAESTVVLDIPYVWLNEVILGKMSIASLFYSFEFRAHYPTATVPISQRVHKWT
jgi:hypothetical protein